MRMKKLIAMLLALSMALSNVGVIAEGTDNLPVAQPADELQISEKAEGEALPEGDAAEEEPAAEQPAEDEPAAEQPAEDEPAAEQPAEVEPAAEQPAAEEPAAEQPAEDEPAAEQPAEDEPTAEQPAEDEPAAEQPAAEDIAEGNISAAPANELPEEPAPEIPDAPAAESVAAPAEPVIDIQNIKADAEVVSEPVDEPAPDEPAAQPPEEPAAPPVYTGSDVITEEDLPDRAVKIAEILDELNENCRIDIYISYDGEHLHIGDEVCLIAVLHGFEDCVFTVQWQESDDNLAFADVVNENELVYRFNVTRENCLKYWRLSVNVTAVEVEDAQPAR